MIAGFGNELRADDGFGVAVIHRLEAEKSSLGAGVELMEIGTGGMRLAQELLSGYDRLVVVDAMTRGGAPGTLYVLRVDDVTAATSVDLHLTVPARAFAVARALGALPAQVYLVGCEPGEVDELSLSLTPPVRAAVDGAVAHVRQLLRTHTGAAARA